MKQTPEESINLLQFKPGQITRHGFLGHDTRHVHDIIREDVMTLNRLGVDVSQIAKILTKLSNAAQAALEARVHVDNFIAQASWGKGQLPCPFIHPGMYHKTLITVTRPDTGESVRFTPLHIHLIEDHSFFQGKGSPYRLEPVFLLQFLRLKS